MKLADATHRPWPLPRSPWVISMEWHDLVFLHWPVRPEVVRPLIPAGLELETWEGQAWMGVVPFEMRNVHGRYLPPIPGTGRFPELNVRTYVTTGGKPGVWFFSLDASSWLAVQAARRAFHLPYQYARMSIATGAGGVRYDSERMEKWAAGAVFRGSYEPVGPVMRAMAGSLEYFLTERYCLYSRSARGRLFRGEIHHLPWPLQSARVKIEENTMSRAIGVELAGVEPISHFAKTLDVRAWAPVEVEL